MNQGSAMFWNPWPSSMRSRQREHRGSRGVCFEAGGIDSLAGSGSDEACPLCITRNQTQAAGWYGTGDLRTRPLSSIHGCLVHAVP